MSKAFLLEQFEAELALNEEALMLVRDEDLGWTPHPESFSLGRLAMHVASIPGWVPAFVAGDAYDMGAGGPGPGIPVSREDILEKFATAAARGRDALAALPAPRLDDRWRLLRHGDVVAEMTRGEAIARYVIRHVVHHRGQLTVYLRLRGVPVPPTYGDSADRRLLPPGLVS